MHPDGETSAAEIGRGTARRPARLHGARDRHQWKDGLESPHRASGGDATADPRGLRYRREVGGSEGVRVHLHEAEVRSERTPIFASRAGAQRLSSSPGTRPLIQTAPGRVLAAV